MTTFGVPRATTGLRLLAVLPLLLAGPARASDDEDEEGAEGERQERATEDGDDGGESAETTDDDAADDDATDDDATDEGSTSDGAEGSSGDRAQAILRKTDAAMNTAEDQVFRYRVTTTEPDGDERTMLMKVWVKGKKRLTRFLAPGDVEGTKALTLSPERMYVYLPAYQKVRRVASHTSRDNFMGTAISKAEMAITRYAPYYDAELIDEDEEGWTLRLTLKPDGTGPHDRIEIDVSKEHHRPVELRYYDEEGDHVKTESRRDYTCRDDVCNMKILEMVDHEKGGLKTVFEREKWRVNTGLSDDRFSVRSLEQAR